MTAVAKPLSIPPAPIPAARSTVRLRAAYFEGFIDLKQFRAANQQYPVFASSPLIIEPEHGCYAALMKFGAVIYWNCSPGLVEHLNAELERMPGALTRNSAVEDELIVRIGEAEDKVTFDEVWLTDLTLDKIKTISVVFAQSVATDRFELEVNEAMKRFGPVVDELSSRGRILVHEREVLRAIGFGLSVRSAVLANLTLFDKLPELWDSESLSRLVRDLTDYFDLEERVSAVHQKLDYFADMNSTIMDVLHTRKSHRLEWIIIILILVEILFFVWLEATRLATATA